MNGIPSSGPERTAKKAIVIREAVKDGRFDDGYLADDPRTGGKVIVRKLADSGAALHGMFDILNARLEAVRMLTHPGIIPPTEILTAGRGVFLINPYTGGTTLRRIVAVYRRSGHGLTPTSFVVLGNQLVRTLISAHSRGVYHGKLTPSHILVDRNRDLKLTDFLFLPSEEKDLSLLGKYAAPEIVRKKGNPGIFSDIYSAAVILYDMIAVPSGTVKRRASLPDWFAEFVKFFTPALSADPVKRTYALAGILEALKRIETRYLNRKDLVTLDKIISRLDETRIPDPSRRANRP